MPRATGRGERFTVLRRRNRVAVHAELYRQYASERAAAGMAGASLLARELLVGDA